MTDPPRTRVLAPAVDGNPADSPTMSASFAVPVARRFGPDDLLAGRYEVVRFIAQGGMGEVYEARDKTLQVVVALKTMRSALATDAGAMERFRREVSLARTVTHPNVCRIFDVGFHRDAQGEVPFLTMELLGGETLAARMARTGPMTIDDARTFVVAMAEALQAAHDVGVVHRDFKPQNVMLVPRPDGSSRVVVTDFGLARTDAPSAGDALTATGAVLGTPAYMAPEQVEGAVVGPAADVYALGVTMFEMATARLPFSGTTPMSVAVKRLVEQPIPLRSLAPSVDERFERAITGCLARAPAERFARAADVVSVLNAPASTAVPSQPPIATSSPAVSSSSSAASSSAAASTPAVASSPPVVMASPPRRWRRRLVAALAVVVMAAGIGVAYVLWPPRAVVVRSAAAVVGFANRVGKTEQAWIGVSLAEMISSELGAGGGIRTVPGEAIARMRDELGVVDADRYAADTLTRIGMYLATDYVVVGSYVAHDGGDLDVVLGLQSTRTGETVGTTTLRGKQTALVDLAGQGAAFVRAKLGHQGAPDEGARARAAFPTDTEAARLYAEGLAHLRIFDAVAARAALEAAAARAPDNALIELALADAWTQLGSETEVRAHAQRAWERSQELPREQKKLVEAKYRAAMYEWPAAIEAYQALFHAYPDQIEYGLKLAEVAATASRYLLLYDTVRRLEGLGERLGDARVYVLRALIAAFMNDVDAARAARAKVDEIAARTGARALVASANAFTAYAEMNAGDVPSSIASFARAHRALEGLRSPTTMQVVLSFEAALLFETGDAAVFAEHVAAYRRLADETRGPDFEASAKLVSSLLHTMRDELEPGRADGNEALAIWQASCLHNCTSFAELAISLNALARGAHREASDAAQRGADTFAQFDMESHAGLMQGIRASALARAGDAAGATAAGGRARSLATFANHRLYAELGSAEARAATRDASDVRKGLADLDDVAARAAAQGFVGIELDVRLARARIAQDRAALEAVAVRAVERGLLRVAREARAAMPPGS